MLGAIFVNHNLVRRRLTAFFEHAIHFTRWVRIEHENLSEMRMGMAEQFEPVLLGAGKRLLMAVYDARAVVLHRPEPDESAAGKPLARIRNAEVLDVCKQAGLRLAHQHPAGNPIVQVIGGTSVYVSRSIIRWQWLAQDDPDQVVRVQPEVPGAHLG